jgi:hypothetical protein
VVEQGRGVKFRAPLFAVLVTGKEKPGWAGFDF